MENWSDLLRAAGTSKLHGDLLIQILVRLPTKSILRFKSVCRAWYALFNSPDFMKRNWPFADAVHKWKTTMVGSVVGSSITVGVLIAFMKRKWPFAQPEFYVKDAGMIVFRFKSLADCDWVRKYGPWSIDPSATRPLLLKAWSEGMAMDWTVFKEVPIWVRILDIPPIYVSHYMLSLIGSGIGKPIMMDDYTASHKLLSYARILVEVNVEEACRKSVKIVHDNGMVCELRIIFERLPKSCASCFCFGHIAEACPNILVTTEECCQVKAESVAQLFTGSCHVSKAVSGGLIDKGKGKGRRRGKPRGKGKALVDDGMTVSTGKDKGCATVSGDKFEGVNTNDDKGAAELSNLPRPCDEGKEDNTKCSAAV